MFAKKNLDLRTNLYVLYDKVSDKCGPTFEAVNHATACRAILNMKDVTLALDEFAIQQLGFVNKYGTKDCRLESFWESWDLRTFLDTYSYKTPALKEAGNA